MPDILYRLQRLFGYLSWPLLAADFLFQWSAGFVLSYLLIGGYIALATLLGIVGEAFLRRQLQALLGASSSNTSALRQAARIVSDIFKIARASLPDALLLLCEVFAWPGVYLDNRRAAKHLGTAEPLILKRYRDLHGSTISSQPASTLVLVLIAHLACFALGRVPTELRIFFTFAIAYVVSLCLALTLSPGALAETARRASGKPFLRAIGLTACLVPIALLSFVALEAQDHFSTSAYGDVAKAILKRWETPFKYYHDRRIGFIHAAEGIVGGILSSAVVMTLVSVGKYSRLVEDQIRLATSEAGIGYPSAALKRLQTLRHKSASSLLVEAVSLMATGQFSAAVKAWHLFHELSAAETPKDEEELVHELLQLMMVMVRPDPTSIQRAYGHWVHLGPDPDRLFHTTVALYDGHELQHVDALNALVQYVPYDRTVASYLAMRMDDFSAARAFSEKSVPLPGGLEVRRRIHPLLLDAWAASEQSERLRIFEAWVSAHWAALQQHIDTLSDSIALQCAASGLLSATTLAQGIGAPSAERVVGALQDVATRLESHSSLSASFFGNEAKSFRTKAFDAQHPGLTAMRSQARWDIIIGTVGLVAALLQMKC